MSEYDEGSATVRFMVQVKDEHFSGMTPILTVAMGAVMVDAAGKIRNPSRSYRSEPGAEWADFQVAAQCDSMGEWYGRRLQYKDAYSVELADAELMVKNLRSLHRKIEKLDAKYGTATDFAAFMARVADAAGCQERPFMRLVNKNPGPSYDDNEYRYMDADDLRYHLRSEVTAWAEKHGIRS